MVRGGVMLVSGGGERRWVHDKDQVLVPDKKRAKPKHINPI